MPTNYRSRRAGGPPKAPRWMDLRYAAPCKVCGRRIAAGDRAFYDYAARTATCNDPECCEADGLTTEVWAGSPTSGAWTKTTSAVRTGPGYRREPTWKERYGRCEDAPCCGCCGTY